MASLVNVSLQHHGAAASSVAEAVVWIPSNDTDVSSCLAYASHAVITIATARAVTLANGTCDFVWKTDRTLRTLISEGQPSLVITTLAYAENSEQRCLVSGFSNGALSVWLQEANSNVWNEYPLENTTDGNARSLTTVSCTWINNQRLGIVMGSSGGASFYDCLVEERSCTVTSAMVVGTSAIKSASIRLHDSLGILVLLGTAAPRHNRILVYSGEADSGSTLQYAGGLTGHEDWITCMCWGPRDMLATGSQDGRIRLWRFATAFWDDSAAFLPLNSLQPTRDVDSETDNDEDNQAVEEEEEGEARLEIFHDRSVTRVTLEALLLGHEERVTGVAWHPSPLATYGDEFVLISSSMDRSIFLWTCTLEDGIWAPLTRVGSAGGILGGSVGSSLLGYLSASVDPSTGKVLLGHAYGGSIHTWRLDDTQLKERVVNENDSLSTEERASLVHWRAKSCVTGHFGSVLDLSWEASGGHYLLSVGRDQTCRLWTIVDSVWLELGRPQVHGYDITCVASISTSEHPHLLVTGADEKELRAFDAPKATLELLKQVAGIPWSDDALKRVERAYIPSLGLSNKATAADAAEEEISSPIDGGNDDDKEVENKNSKLGLPVERDLGAVSLWPEIRKLFGHNTELYCLTSTLAARTSRVYARQAPSQVLVASTCKARDAESASIRLWNVNTGTCHQVLSGGHKATVATLAFSPCGSYLLSAGKDRRLCLWKKKSLTNHFELEWAQDNSHKRIIWSVHFCPWDPDSFVSGSRDGIVKVWRICHDSAESSCVARVFCSFSPAFSLNGRPDAVTALSIRPTTWEDGVALLAVGLESGRLEFWTIPMLESSKLEPALIQSVPLATCHRAAITKLAWRPQPDKDEPESYLASSSLDHGVRIFQIK